ncbi:glucose dehydrogenase [FAD, quinone]-like [Vanessa atalanta]|uniref:glucose dehydrogenase [FAD, quinone]-like n=1 Tax=Vanessa atalanta TaxID=42275 RepID=UPI001FCDC12A|nr:glucose dehydrogenase [FAD, quinone]-like [Vanessa atalanta]
MSPIHLAQLCLFSIGIYAFSLFTYLVFYYDLFSTLFLSEIKSEYDFIIVGSGTAGSLIGHRLAKETNYTFIVLEAGGRGHSFHDIPAFGPLLHQSVFDWNYETEPQENACFAMENSRCKQTQGKILGGSSKLNNMLHIRGNTSHYVEWFHGKYNKNYIEDQFKYIESNIFHLNNIQYDSNLGEAVLRAARELNFKLLKHDFGIGFMKSIVTQNQGKRWTTSYNLENSKYVFTNVLVEKLIFIKNKCIGAQITTPKRMTLFAKKGVIISAGTFNSPKILQLSGIGPEKLLNSLNIPVIKSLPVGKNLQDHIGTGLDLVLFNNSQSIEMFDIMNLWNVFQYFFNGKGPLTTPGCEVIGFISTKNETSPNLQFMVLPVGISADRGSHLRKTLKIRDTVWNDYFSKIFDKYTATFLTLLLHPKSKGEVRIQSKNPTVPPLIDPKYLSHKDDLRTIVNGVHMIRKLIETESLKNIGAHLNNIPFPGCENFEMFSNLYLECYVKHLTLTSYHPVGTCAMGLPETKNSVVDTTFKVIGIDNLYVVDASVLPTLPSGNINAAIAMMANIFFENNFKEIVNINKKDFCNKISFRDFLLNTCPVR